MWIEVVSGPDRGRAVEVAGEPVTIGSGTGCALVVHGARVEPAGHDAHEPTVRDVRTGRRKTVRLRFA